MNSILSNAVSSLTGNVTKAILFVRNKNLTGTTIKEAEDSAAAIREKMLTSTSSALSLGSQKFSSVNSNCITAGSGYRPLEVQYNPSTLTISSQGAGDMIDYGEGDKIRLSRTSQSFEQAVSVLHCQLIFDDTNVGDAFVKGEYSPTIGSVISTGSQIAKLVTGKSYTVRPQMDAIMGLLTNDLTRQVLFVWGSMSFRGELTSVDNTYTMFNKSGNPIRGVMDITIRQEKASAGDMQYWSRAYMTKFERTSVTGKTSLLSKATNNSILNLNL